MNSDIKATIDKTVGYLLKNGESFRKRLQENNKNNKFDFLNEDNEHHAYFKQQLEERKNAAPVDTVPKDDDKEQEIAAPRELHFLTRLPFISAQDLEVIKLTAQFSARNGDAFLSKLLKHQAKQGNSAQFDFTKSSHSLYSLFRHYVGQYRRIIDDQIRIPDDVMEAAKARARYDAQHKTEKSKEKKRRQEQQISYASIDWQDFSIVSNIVFDAVDAVKELPIPLKKEDLLLRTLEQRRTNLELQTAPIKKKEEEPVEPHDDTKPKPFVPKGIKIKAAGESRLKKQTGEQMIKCPITGKLVPSSKFDTHLRILVRDPRYKQEQANYMKKNHTYESNLTTDQVYENIKRLVRGEVEGDKKRMRI